MRQKIGLETWIDYIFAGYKQKNIHDYKTKIDIIKGKLHAYVEKNLQANVKKGKPAELDTVALTMLGFLNCYPSPYAKVYRIAERFGFHLLRTNINIPCSVLKIKEQFKYYWIDFPDGVRFKAEDKSVGYQHAVICIAKDPKNVLEPKLHIFAQDFDDDNKRIGTTTELYFTLKADKNIDDMIEGAKKNSNIPDCLPKEMVYYCLKCILYIESGEPDLEDVKANVSKSTKDHKIKNHLRYHSPFDFVNVGYGFHHRMQHTDAWEVSGHFRWQRYGQDLGLVKLIWIDAYEKGWKDKV